jgi:hypothetical protein
MKSYRYLHDAIFSAQELALFEFLYDCVLDVMTEGMADELQKYAAKKENYGAVDPFDFKNLKCEENAKAIEEFGTSISQLIENLIEQKSPSKKFLAFSTMHTEITKAFEDYVKIKEAKEKTGEEKKFSITADDVLNVFIHVCMRSDKSLIVHLKMMFEFLAPNSFGGQSGFYLTSLQLAIQYIMNLESGVSRQSSDQVDVTTLQTKLEEETANNWLRATRDTIFLRNDQDEDAESKQKGQDQEDNEEKKIEDDSEVIFSAIAASLQHRTTVFLAGTNPNLYDEEE